MKKIPLTQGQFAIVDDDNYIFLMQWSWHVIKKKRKTKIVYYAARKSTKNGKRIAVLMHRVINSTPEHMETDHKDENGLNNRKKNLRNAFPYQNAVNRSKHKGETSKYKGVSWDKEQNKWRAQITANKIRYSIGRFDTQEKAYLAYCKAAKKLHGEFYRRQII